MNYFQKVINSVFYKKSENSRNIRLVDGTPVWWSLNFGNADFTEANTKEFLKNGFGTNPFIFMVIDYIADIIANLPVSIKKDGKGFEDRDLKKLLRNPNSNDSGDDFIYKAIANLLTTGNCFIYGLRPVGFSRYAELEVLHTPEVNIYTDNGTQYGKVEYYTYLDIPGQIDPEDLLHIKFPNIVKKTNWGMSALQPGHLTYKSSNAQIESENFLYKNRGVSGILSSKDANYPMLPNEKKQVQDDMNKQIGGVEKTGQVMVTNAALDFLQLGMTPEQLELAKSNISKLRIACSLYNIESVLFNDPENKTYNNRLEAEKAAYNNSILPTANKFFREFSDWLLQDNFKIEEGEIAVNKNKISILNLPNKELSDKVLAELEKMIITREEARLILYPNGFE